MDMAFYRQHPELSRNTGGRAIPAMKGNFAAPNKTAGMKPAVVA
jgi:hypothetical protein